MSDTGGRATRPPRDSVDVGSPGRDEVAEGIAAELLARCARELRCENIGPDKKYSSMDDCEARVKSDWRDDLNARECPSGIDQAQLNESLDEIRNEDCANPFDTLGRVAACTVGQLCEG